jgi:hypothetical protein
LHKHCLDEQLAVRKQDPDLTLAQHALDPEETVTQDYQRVADPHPATRCQLGESADRIVL